MSANSRAGRFVVRWLSEQRNAAWLRGCNGVGLGADLCGRPYIKNEGVTRIGTGFRLSSRPVVSHLVTGPQGRLEIGDRVAIDYGAAIACLSSVRIGDGTRIGPFCVLADSDFHVVGDRDKTPEPRPVQIGDRVQIGARVTIVPGTSIGDGAIVCAHSVVGGVVSAGTVVSGVPARIRVDERSVLTGASDLERIPDLVRRILGLRYMPALTHGPDDFAEWDSLGSLRLLLAIEDELGLRLAEHDMLRVHTVADLVAAVQRASS